MKWSRTCSSLSWTFCFLQKMQPLLVHHMAAILCQQHHTTVLQKRNGEQVLCLKLKRDLSHKSLQHIIRQTGGQAGYHHSTTMGTLMGKGQGFDLMPKQSASYSLHNAVRQTTPFCWKTINLMLWKQNILLWGSIILGAFDPGLSWSSSPDNLCAWSSSWWIMENSAPFPLGLHAH